jgi:uncharacterized membrane protein (DUF2068 family)
MSSRIGLKLVAVLEAAKGIVVFAAGFGLFRLVHRDVQAAAENLVRHLHLDPLGQLPRALIDASSRIDDAHLRMLALGAIAYSVVRCAEAYGLWTDRRWAEWFGALSGGVYLPLELYKLAERVTWTRFTVLAVNGAIVGYLVFVLVRKRADRAATARARPADAGP